MDEEEEEERGNNGSGYNFKTGLRRLERMSISVLKEIQSNPLNDDDTENLEQLATDFVAYREMYASQFLSMIGGAMDEFLNLNSAENEGVTLKRWKDLTAELTDKIITAIALTASAYAGNPAPENVFFDELSNNDEYDKKATKEESRSSSADYQQPKEKEEEEEEQEESKTDDDSSSESEGSESHQSGSEADSSESEVSDAHSLSPSLNSDEEEGSE